MPATEAIQIEFDWNGDGVFDTIAGTPMNVEEPILIPKPFWVAPDLFSGTQLPAKPIDFGKPLPGVGHFIGAVNAAAPELRV